MKIYFKFLNNENIYRMESLYKLGINGFVSNFGASKFKCTEYNYNEKTGRIGKLIFEQIN